MAGNLYDEALESLDEQRPAGPQQGPVNPYLQTIDQMETARARAMRTAVIIAHDTTPERAAEVRRLSDATGLAPEVVDRNFKDLSKRVTVEAVPYADMLRDTPVLAEWAADPNNAALAKDDMEQMGFLEWLVTAPQRAIAQEFHSQRYGALRTKSLFGALTPAERDEMENAKFNAAFLGELGAGQSWFRGAITGGAKFAGFLAGASPYAAAGAIGGGAIGAIGGTVVEPGGGTVAGAVAGGRIGWQFGQAFGLGKIAFETSAGSAYDQFLGMKDELGRPMDPEVARAAALGVGAINAMLLGASGKIVLKSIPGAEKLTGRFTQTAVGQALRNPTIRLALAEAMKTYGKTLTAGTALIVAQQAVTIMGGELAKAVSGQPFEGATPSQVSTELLQAAASAVQTFALASAVGPLMAFRHDAARAVRAQQGEALFTALGEGVAQSKTVKRMPEAAQAFLEQATKDGPVKTLYMPVAPFAEYWQSKGIDPRDVARTLTGETDAYDRAIQTGEDLPIPTARYAVQVAGTEHHPFFSQELRLGPDEMNAREAKAFQQSLVADIAQRQEAPAAAETRTAVIRAAVVEQLEGAGVPRETAETYATLYEATLGTIAERAGLDPAALYARYGLTIARLDLLEAAAAAPAAEAVTPEAPVISARAAARTPEQAALDEATTFSLLEHLMGGPRLNLFQDLLRPPLLIDDIQARKLGMPSELAADINLLAEERAWREAVRTPGRTVILPSGVEGRVVEARNFPTGERVLIEHQHEGATVQRWYDADTLKLTQPSADVLPTGELQPRLPGEVGAVREQEVATPQFEAPFGLKPEVAKAPREKQTTLFQQPAYHGSAHLFERFSLHAIGTGEGAQAYGWGLYFASKREIAQRYREDLSAGKDSTVEGGGRLPDWVAHELAGRRSAADFQKNADDLIVEFKGRIVDAEERVASKASQWWMDQANLPGLREIVVGLEHAKAGAKISTPGRVYKVEVPDDADFLDWDKPASEQSPKVQAALKALGIDWEAVPVPSPEDALELFESPRLRQLALEDIGINDELREGYHLAKQAAVLDVLDVGTTAQLQNAWRQWFYRNAGLFTGRGRLDPTGEHIYDQIGTQIAAAEMPRMIGPGGFPIQQRASEALAAQGIAGIRYLDGFSRGTGAGSSNFVVFDDKLVQITEYYQRGRFVSRARPTGVEADQLNEALDTLTQQVRDAAPAGSRLEAFIDAAGELFVANIEVPAAERGKGAGTRMMQQVLAWADDHKLQVSLDARPDRGKKGALAEFYRNLGFVRNGSARFYDPSAKGELVRPALSERREMFGQQRRGSITFGPDQQVTINLLERADLSTFLHESGHFFLNVFSDVVDQLNALSPDALTAQQQRMVADYQEILKSLKVQDRTGLGEEQHEQFARTFEAYLMKGEAPSLELRSAFARFRAWLIGVYRTLRGLNVDLSDQVRQVFDRMLASDDAIAQAEAVGRIDPMFTTADSAGMSELQFGLYREKVSDASRTAREQLERKLMTEVQREQQATWKAQRGEIEQAVAADVHQQPVYRALVAMQRGTHPDGTALVEGMETEPLKLSKTLIVQRYGEERLKRLPTPSIYSVEGGLDPDAVAQMFGFSSGDDLLTAIEQAPPMRLAINAETQRRMLQQHGSLLLDGTLHEAAQAAVANEDRELVIRAELRALSQLRRTAEPFVRAEHQRGAQGLAAAGAERAYERRWLEAEAKLRVAIAEGHKQVEIDALHDEVQNFRQKARGGPATIRAAIPPANVLRDAAATRIAQTRVRNLAPQPFWSASRRAAQSAIDAAARQDFEGAIVAKQQELITLALYREAMRARDDVDARVRRTKELAKPVARARLGKAGETYIDQVDGILDRYEFATVSQKALDRRGSLRKFVAGLEGEGLPVDLPEELVEETRRVNYQELTVEELVGVTDGLQQIVHLARLKNRLLTNARHRELDAAAGALSGSIREHLQRKAREGARDRRPSEERRRMVGDFFAGHRKLASFVREMDGFRDGGAAWDTIMRPLNEAGAREAEMNVEATHRFGEIVDRAFPGKEKRTLYTKRYLVAVDKSLSKMERLMVALNWGNDGNRDRVRRAEGWTDEQVQAVLNTLTPADLDFVQGVFDFLDSYWPAIKAKQERVYGIAPEKVEATPIRTASGTIRGGYFPLKYDDRRSPRAMAGLDFEAANLARQAAYAQATTRRGHTKARLEHVSLPVRLDFGVMFEHVAQVIHDLSHHEVLIDVGRVLGRPEVQQAIVETQGDLVYKQIRNTIRDVAFGQVPAVNGFERAINHIRQGATIAGLGWNLAVSLMQPLGLANSIVRIGPKWIGVGLVRWLRNPFTMSETVHWIEEQSPLMRSRGRTLQREINEIRNTVGVHTGKLRGWIDEAISTATFDTVTRQGIADSYFWLIQQAQRVADIPTWLGQYEKSMAAGESETRAAALADQAVLDSQGGGQTKDLAQVQRGGPMMRLWTNFYSYFNVVYNQAVEARRQTHFRNPVEVGRLASDYLMLFIVPATLAYFIREALRPRTMNKDESLWVDLARENLSYAAGTMLGLRETSGVIQGWYGYEGPSGTRMFAALSRLGKQVEQAELDAAFWKALNDTAGVLFHYPASQVQRSVGGIAALAEGKTENPGVVIAGPPKGRK